MLGYLSRNYRLGLSNSMCEEDVGTRCMWPWRLGRNGCWVIVWTIWLGLLLTCSSTMAWSNPQAVSDWYRVSDQVRHWLGFFSIEPQRRRCFLLRSGIACLILGGRDPAADLCLFGFFQVTLPIPNGVTPDQGLMDSIFYLVHRYRSSCSAANPRPQFAAAPGATPGRFLYIW